MEVVVFTMKGCPHCDNLKEKLNENNIKFIEKDVDKHEKTYEKFSEAVDSEYLPAILIGKKAFIPERSFTTIEEASKNIKNYLLEQSHRDHR